MYDRLAGLTQGHALHAAAQTRARQSFQPSSITRTAATATATAVVTAPATAPQIPVPATKQLSLRTKPRRHMRRHRNSSSNTDTHRAASPRPLACPFYKRNPERYHACARAASIHNTRSAREHVLTDHLAPIYCPVCASHFPSAIARDEHIRARSCTERELAAEAIEGATDDQVEKLLRLQWDARRRGMGGDDEEASWFRMWDVLFPGVRRPTTARLSSPRGGEGFIPRRAWRRVGPGVMEAELY